MTPSTQELKLLRMLAEAGFGGLDLDDERLEPFFDGDCGRDTVNRLHRRGWIACDSDDGGLTVRITENGQIAMAAALNAAGGEWRH